MPARDSELGPLIRSVFLPEAGEVWCSPDISQQEFRFVVHHAFIRKLPGAAAALERYHTDADVDFHALAGEITGLSRADAKGVNFAKIYGAGVKKFAEMIGKPLHEAQQIYGRYDQRLPFVSRLAAACEREARQHGYTVLYDGARRHWDRWAPGGRWQKTQGPCPRDEAIERITDPTHPWYRKALWRTDVRTALNALIQGSAARHTKLWMRACWREGIVPLLQMHDALELSTMTREQSELVARLACEVVKLEVPMRTDVKYGRSWGDATHAWEELHGETPTIAIAAPELEEIPTEIPTVPPQPTAPTTEIPATTPSPPLRYNGNHRDGFDSDIRFVSLRDIVGEPVLDGKIRCPFHDDNTPSCHIYHDHYHCFACGAHGDRISWLMDVEGLSYPAALEALANWEPSARPIADDDSRTVELAANLWNEAKSITGTLAAQYLTFRHIDVDQLPTGETASLRFHPNCPFGKGRYPCLLGLFRDVETDAFAGIHRTALTADGHKIDRRMLGRWRGRGRRAIKLWPAENTLVVGEGLETVAAAATRILHEGQPLRPAWVLGSATALANFGPVEGIERIIILADNDSSGNPAAYACAMQWFNHDRTALLLTPEHAGHDFNDVVRAKAT
jgi:hypothetical protein